MTATLTTPRRTILGIGAALLVVAGLGAGTIAAVAAPTISGSDFGSEWVVSDESPILTGTDPRRPVVSPDGATLYIPNFGSDSVTIVETATNTVTLDGIIPGSGPLRVAVSPDNTLLYVYAYTADNVYVLNVPAFTLNDTIPVDPNTYDILLSPDGTTLYGQAGQLLNEYDVATHVAGTALDLNVNNVSIAITPDGSTIYGAAYSEEFVKVVDVASWTIDAATIPAGTAPNSADVSPDGTRLYIGNNVSDDVTVIDTSDNSVITTIAGLDGANGTSFSPDGRYAYVLEFNGDAFSTIDVATNVVVSSTTTTANTPDEIAISADGRQIYVADDDVVIYNALELSFTGPGEIAKGQASTVFDLALLDGNTVNGDYSAEDFRVEILDSNSAVVATGTAAIGLDGLAEVSVATGSLPAGTYSLRVTVDGRTLLASGSGFVVAGVLPPTGIDPLPAFVFGAGLLLIGGAAFTARRRRA